MVIDRKQLLKLVIYTYASNVPTQTYLTVAMENRLVQNSNVSHFRPAPQKEWLSLPLCHTPPE